MPKATIDGGRLVPLASCYVFIPNFGNVEVKSLPDLEDTKAANYSDQPIMGRAFPLKTYSHSENRSISLVFHFYAITSEDLTQNLQYLRAIESATYPREGNGGSPFTPPPVCRIRCGKLLGEEELCVVLRQYSVRFPTDVAWDEDNYIPYKFDVSTSWDVVYRSSQLPGQNRILDMGR